MIQSINPLSYHITDKALYELDVTHVAGIWAPGPKWKSMIYAVMRTRLYALRGDWMEGVFSCASRLASDKWNERKWSVSGRRVLDFRG